MNTEQKIAIVRENLTNDNTQENVSKNLAKILIDIGGFVAFFEKDDNYHQMANTPLNGSFKCRIPNEFFFHQ